MITLNVHVKTELWDGEARDGIIEMMEDTMDARVDGGERYWGEWLCEDSECQDADVNHYHIVLQTDGTLIDQCLGCECTDEEREACNA